MSTIKNKNLEISIHLLVWMILLFLPAAFSMGSDVNWKEIFVRFWLQIFFLGIIFYANYFFLVKRFYSNQKVIFVITNLLIIAMVILGKNLIFQSLGPGPMPMRERPRMNPNRRPPQEMRYFMDALFALIPIAFSIAINSGKKLQLAEEIQREAENIKLKSELQHLKYQLQPHFFFNSLNNIYSLIDFAPEKAKQSVHSLSKLMRHLLYKTDVEKISLSDEIEFLNKYIELMSLRLNDKTTIYTDFPKQVPNLQISPLMFISIVENAFKHGVSATEHSDIHFKMEVLDDTVFFQASNSNFPKSDSDKSGSGIGIENLRKSLTLLYPNKHEFSSYINGNMYIAELKIMTK